MEHRWGHRQEISRPVRLRLGTRGGVVARGTLKDCSISGGFIVTSLPIGVYAHVQVLFTHTLGGKRSVTAVEAQVVRRDSSGIGIEWGELAPEVVRELMLSRAFSESAPSAPEPSSRPSGGRLHHR